MLRRKQGIIFCLLDYKNAFDTVQHKPLMQLYRNKNINTRDIRITKNFYYKQEATVRINSSITDKIKIRRGVE